MDANCAKQEGCLWIDAGADLSCKLGADVSAWQDMDVSGSGNEYAFYFDSCGEESCQVGIALKQTDDSVDTYTAEARGDGQLTTTISTQNNYLLFYSETEGDRSQITNYNKFYDPIIDTINSIRTNQKKVLILESETALTFMINLISGDGSATPHYFFILITKDGKTDLKVTYPGF